MLYDLFTKVDEFVRKVQTWSTKSASGGIHSLYLTGDLAMHRLRPQTKVQFLLILEGEDDECLQHFAKWNDPMIEVEVISSSNLPLYCPFDSLRFQKARLLCGKGISLQSPTIAQEEEAHILQQRLTTYLLQAQTHLDESILGDCLEVIFYLKHGFILSKIREYLYNTFYQIPHCQCHDLLRGAFLKLLVGERCSASEMALLIHYIATMEGVPRKVQALLKTMDATGACNTMTADAIGANEISINVTARVVQENADATEMEENQ